MRPDNIAKFTEAVAADPALQAKVQSIHTEAARAIAEKMAALSAGPGAAFTAKEFLEAGRAHVADLSEEDLEKVAGGIWKPDAVNIVTSIISFGIGCAAAATLSAAVDGHADKCQFSQ